MTSVPAWLLFGAFVFVAVRLQATEMMIGLAVWVLCLLGSGAFIIWWDRHVRRGAPRARKTKARGYPSCLISDRPADARDVLGRRLDISPKCRSARVVHATGDAERKIIRVAE